MHISFYVADDEKAICLDDLLKENSDKTLGVEFYLSLLADLSDLILEEKAEDKVNLVSTSYRVPQFKLDILKLFQQVEIYKKTFLYMLP